MILTPYKIRGERREVRLYDGRRTDRYGGVWVICKNVGSCTLKLTASGSFNGPGVLTGLTAEEVIEKGRLFADVTYEDLLKREAAEW